MRIWRALGSTGGISRESVCGCAIGAFSLKFYGCGYAFCREFRKRWHGVLGHLWVRPDERSPFLFVS